MVPLCSTLKLPNELFLAPKHTLSLFILNQGAAEKKKKKTKITVTLSASTKKKFWIDHYEVVNFVSLPLSEREAEVDLVLIQTSFLFLWKLCLKNNS